MLQLLRVAFPELPDCRERECLEDILSIILLRTFLDLKEEYGREPTLQELRNRLLMVYADGRSFNLPGIEEPTPPHA